MTRDSVTMALSGDGGDEVFSGYNRYHAADSLWGKVSMLPRFARGLGARALRSVSPAAWNRMMRIVPGMGDYPQAGERIHKLASMLDARDGDDMYRRLISQWYNLEELLPDVDEPDAIGVDAALEGAFKNLSARLRYLDTRTYLPDDILTKVDRASMAASLEVRVPILDHRVVEFAWKLPPNQLMRGGQSKWLLRQVLYRHVPKHLIERPKVGFGVPLGQWLRGGELRDWAEDLLDVKTMEDQGIFKASVIRKAWHEHLDGTCDHQHKLWAILMFQSWQKKWM